MRTRVNRGNLAAARLLSVMGAMLVAIQATTARADVFVFDGDTQGLVDAIHTANANGGTETIRLARDGVYSFTQAYDLSRALPTITTELVIRGDGAVIERCTEGGTPEFGIITIAAEGRLTLEDLTIRNGWAGESGGILNEGRLEATDVTISNNIGDSAAGGIRNSATGNMTLRRCTIRGNVTVGDTSSGGGLWNDGNVLLEDCIVRENTAGTASNTGLGGGIFTSNLFFVRNSTITENSATVGGGIFISSGEVAEMINSTISGNNARQSGGAIHQAAGSATMLHCTVADNAAPDRGGIQVLTDGSLRLSNSIVANNPAGDCLALGTLIDQGYNLIGDGSCITDSTSFADDPLLGPLTENDGLTPTRALLPGSPAIDAGDCVSGFVSEDQRGYARAMGAACDIGAVETCAIPAIVPNRDAALLSTMILCANADDEATRINLAPQGVYSLTEAFGGSHGLPPIDSEVEINGNGAIIERSTRAGTPGFGILWVKPEGHLTLQALTIRNADSFFSGGGIVNEGTFEATDIAVIDNYAHLGGGGIANASTGTMSLTRCLVQRNIGASEAPANLGGGGIYNNGVATLVDCTVDQNIAGGRSDAGWGGGIRNYVAGVLHISGSTISDNLGTAGGGLLTEGLTRIENSTISGNFADDSGGAIHVSLGTTELTACTLADNHAPGYGGLEVGLATVTLSNSIIATNSGGDCAAADAIADAGHNIIGDGSCLSHPTSFAANPLLRPLANNGGPTGTHALMAGSPAIDAGDCDAGTVGTDQRGIARPLGFGCDIGAVEARCAADINGDGAADMLDLSQVLLQFGQTGDGHSADLNADGHVNLTDLGIMLSGFGRPC